MGRVLHLMERQSVQRLYSAAGNTRQKDFPPNNVRVRNLVKRLSSKVSDSVGSTPTTDTKFFREKKVQSWALAELGMIRYKTYVK